MQKGWRTGERMRGNSRVDARASERERGGRRTMGGGGGWEIRKEINSAIDKRPVKRQSAPVWVDEALSILDKKHNRRYPGDIELALALPPFFRFARIFFLPRAESRVDCQGTRCNVRDLFGLVSLYRSFLAFPSPFSPYGAR